MSRFVSQRVVPFIAATNKEDLVTLKDLIEAGKVTPVIDRRYPFAEVPEAVRYLEEGHARGKVVVNVT
jgi:NADPH:quinone reductase-like Zn-dependent oxidoreductase